MNSWSESSVAMGAGTQAAGEQEGKVVGGSSGLENSGNVEQAICTVVSGGHK